MIGLSVVLPCWRREELTYRILENIDKQTYTNVELFILGDCCPIFTKMMQSERFQNLIESFKNKFANVVVMNFENHDGTSAQAINYAIANAQGEYFIWLSNDDQIYDFHFEKYYTKCKEKDSQLGYFDTLLDPGDGKLITRYPFLALTKIGHSELCVKTEIAKKAPPHSKIYGHDWQFISWCVNNGVKCEYIYGKPSYVVNFDNTRERSWDGAWL